MIQLANETTRHKVRKIWKEVFGDTDEYMDLYFSEKYKDENTLVDVEDGKVVSSLQMLLYEITFYGEKIPFYYLSGLSSLPEYRGRGIMGRLIEASHLLMKEREIPLSILVPAEEKLFGYYERFGYTQTFRKSPLPSLLSLKEILGKSENETVAFDLFDKEYNQPDFCVQKNFSDFQTIIKEEIYEGFQPKQNLWGVARIIDAERLLTIYSKVNSQNRFVMKLIDRQFGNRIFQVGDGKVGLVQENVNVDFSVDEGLFCRLLFGFDTATIDNSFSSFFPEQNPIMNYMLE